MTPPTHHETTPNLRRANEPLHQALAHIRAGRWDEAHQIVQQDASALAAWLHGLLHVQEGDLDNAAYWYRQAGRAFSDRGTWAEEVDAVEAALRCGGGGAGAVEVIGPRRADRPWSSGAR